MVFKIFVVFYGYACLSIYRTLNYAYRQSHYVHNIDSTPLRILIIILFHPIHTLHNEDVLGKEIKYKMRAIIIKIPFSMYVVQFFHIRHI